MYLWARSRVKAFSFSLSLTSPTPHLPPPPCQVRVPSSCMYLWARLPGGLEDDLNFCMQLVGD